MTDHEQLHPAALCIRNVKYLQIENCNFSSQAPVPSAFSGFFTNIISD